MAKKIKDFHSFASKTGIKRKKFYVTTPIYYPNDIPHIGHAYTTITADVISRWNKIKGNDVFFLTGTDDHGKKILDAANKSKKDPKKFTDKLNEFFSTSAKMGFAPQ